VKRKMNWERISIHGRTDGQRFGMERPKVELSFVAFGVSSLIPKVGSNPEYRARLRLS
jgi:hypothetical protein